MKEGGCNALDSRAGTDSAHPSVLLVDDEAFMRTTMGAALEAAGCRVNAVCGGEDAIDAFLRLRPHLVILDLVMPGMDGFETCSALRKLEEGRHLPILVVTSQDDSAALHKAFEAGATDFISKPFKDELLGYRARYLIRSSRVLEELGRSEANLRLLRAAVESLPVGITISDPQGKIIYTNPAEAKLHGFEVKELLNQDARILAPQQLHSTSLSHKLDEYGLWRRESVNRHKSGEEFQVQLSSVAVRNPAGECLGIVTSCEDITERKKNERKIHKLAYYDSLTGLPNRPLFMNRLQKALAHADRSKETIALLFLDLDNFKDINDTRGHEFGDKLLQKVAHRLAGCTRAADNLARIGGDEFVVMLSAETQETVGTMAQRILENFHNPLEVNGQAIYAGFSIGIAMYPHDASDQEALLRSADTAMYQAKARGRENYQFYSAEMNRQVREKVALESSLRHALEDEKLTLAYQPQQDLKSRKCRVVEALVRWNHPPLGEISPDRFIPLAEGSGQILRLGEWVLRSACAQAKNWAEQGCPVERVAVNVSGHQLLQRQFPELIENILKETKLHPSGLELEFTENVLMDHTNHTVSILQNLKDMGIQLSIDDFGTGYSSLSYLRNFPVDRIKIDRSFIKGIESNPGDAAIVEAIIALARTLNIKVLAEGVETLEQLEFLKRIGCHEAQGFLLASPMTATDLARWFESAQEF